MVLFYLFYFLGLIFLAVFFFPFFFYSPGIFILIFALLSTSQTVSAAGHLHLNMLTNIFRSPMAFFDTTPIGRIVNRFSRDVETIDNNLPATIRSFYGCVFSVIGTIITITYSTPIFLVIIPPLGLLYWLIQVKAYIKFSFDSLFL